MTALRNRTCPCCGASQMTRSRSEVCLKCSKEKAKEELIIEEFETLSGFYKDVEGPVVDVHRHRTWTFVHAECGTRQTWVYGNFLKRIKADPSNVPCSYCGGQRRSKNGTAVSAENRKIKNPVGWVDYLHVVRRMTERTYVDHKAEINPLDLPRGMHTNHLDHILPISEGYEQGLPPEFVARKENLQMLPAFDNLSKGRKVK